MNPQSQTKQVYAELLSLILSAGLTLLLSSFLFGKDFLSSIDFHLHDTYLVMAPMHVLLPMFLLLTFLLYFIKTYRNSFRKTLSNWVLVIIGIAFILSLSFLTKTISQAFMIENNVEHPLVTITATCFFVAQVLTIAMLLFAVFRWGKEIFSSES